MEKENFLKILMCSTPEELNKFISDKGQQKMVNVVTFITPQNTSSEEKGESANGKCSRSDK